MVRGEAVKLRDVAKRDVAAIGPSATIREARGLIRTAVAMPVPVVENGRLVGTLTARDLDAAQRGGVGDVPAGRAPDETPIRQVMRPDVVFCYDDQEPQEARWLMEQHGIERLLVLSRDRQLVGEVTRNDLGG